VGFFRTQTRSPELVDQQVSMHLKFFYDLVVASADTQCPR
jgi:hypothetical protein